MDDSLELDASSVRLTSGRSGHQDSMLADDIGHSTDVGMSNGKAHEEDQLSERHVEHPLARKAKRICATKISQDVLQNLELLGTADNIKDATARRRLQSQLEARMVHQHNDLRSDVGRLVRKVEDAHEELSFVNTTIAEKIRQLKLLRDASGHFIQETKTFDVELKAFNDKLSIVKKIISALTLSSLEADTLQRPFGIDDRSLPRDFFEALHRSVIVAERCTSLVRIHSPSQVLGTQLLDRVSRLQEVGYQNLYRWCAEECRKLSAESPMIGATVCEALSHLQTRNAMLVSVLDEYAIMRKSVVTSAFLAALNQGSSASSGPLELHSYDALRYCTLVLGWIHQAVATERDYLMLLLKDIKPTIQDFIIPRVFSTLTEGLLPLLQTRLEHVVSAEENAVVLFRVHHWIKFYVEKIRTIVGDSAPAEKSLVSSLTSIIEATFTRYLSVLRNIGAQISKKVDVPPENLEPAAVLTSILSLLRELTGSQEFVHSADGSSSGENMAALMSVVLEPLLRTCNQSASHVTPNTATAMSVYLLNCMHVIRTALFSRPGTDNKTQELLARQSDAHVGTVVNEVTANVITNVRMRPLLDVLRFPEDSRTPPEDVDVEDFLAAFDQYLTSPDGFLPRELRLLLDPQTRSMVIRTSQSLVSDYYRQVFPLISGRYSSSPKSPELVQRLLASA